jgi:hypothetical protein
MMYKSARYHGGNSVLHRQGKDFDADKLRFGQSQMDGTQCPFDLASAMKKNGMVRRLPVITAMVFAWFTLSSGAGLAADAVSLTFQEKDHVDEVKGSFNVGEDPQVAWDVLTDYEHLPNFVGSLKKSHIKESFGPYHFLLEQEFEGGFLFITRRVRVVLDVQESKNQSINFTDTEHKDFAFYQGSWQLGPDPGKGAKITYTLKAKKNFDSPFAGDYMRGGIKDLLDSVRREILRRQDAKEKAQSLSAHLTQQTPPPGD